MDSLVAWIVDCSQKNLAMNRKIITAKALELYEIFAAKSTNHIQSEDNDDFNDQQRMDATAAQPVIQFSACKTWFYTFMKRYGLKIVRSRRAANSDDRSVQQPM